MNPERTHQLRIADKQYLWHPFTHTRQWIESDPLVISAADGMYLIDSDGNRYLDGVSSLWCNVWGHRVPEIDNAIRGQLDRVAHSTMLGLASEPAILLAERLIQIAPPGLAKVFYSDSGATAAEVAFKLAVQYWFNLGKPEKCEFVGFSEAYHGDTLGAMSIGRTTAFHRPYFPLLFKVHFAPTPFTYRYETQKRPALADAPSVSEVCADALFQLDQILAEHAATLAAVCIEPIVQGAAGMIIHPPGFLAGVRALCDRYDVLMIADEVAVGFGRTGRMFACEHESVSPDLICVAKGITGGYLPLAATLATQKIFDAFLGEPWEGRTFFHGHTYTGNPLAAAAAIASLDLFMQRGLIASLAEKASALSGLLAPLKDLPHVGEIRQKGMMVGIELVADKETKAPFDPRRRIGAAVCQACRKHGVIIRPLGDVIVLMPPLAMGLDDLQTVVNAVTHEVKLL
jgi:adenosylmethionine-8-amino-7-oxononanoate aminotransferase